MKNHYLVPKFKNDILRYPRLDTVLMIEKALYEHSGEDKTARQIWQGLPRKVMWQTFVTTLDYLEHSGKILRLKDKTIIWTWNPKLLARVRREGVEV